MVPAELAAGPVVELWCPARHDRHGPECLLAAFRAYGHARRVWAERQGLSTAETCRVLPGRMPRFADPAMTAALLGGRDV